MLAFIKFPLSIFTFLGFSILDVLVDVGVGRCSEDRIVVWAELNRGLCCHMARFGCIWLIYHSFTFLRISILILPSLSSYSWGGILAIKVCYHPPLMRGWVFNKSFTGFCILIIKLLLHSDILKCIFPSTAAQSHMVGGFWVWQCRPHRDVPIRACFLPFILVQTLSARFSLSPRVRNKETIPQSFCFSRFGVKAIIIKDFSSPPYFIFPKQREATIFSLTGRRVWDKEMISRPLLRTIPISPPTVLAAQSSILNSESPRQRNDSSPSPGNNLHIFWIRS